MRQTFLSNVPIWEQLMRTAGHKQVGRKHNHTIGPSKKAAAAQTTRDVKKKAAIRKFNEQTALYFAGFRDTMPLPPYSKKK